MAITTVPTFHLPETGASQTVVGLSSTAFTFDASTDKLAAIIDIPQDGTLTAIEFRIDNSTLGSSTTFTMSLETLSGTPGLPTGTLIDDPTNAATGTVAVTGADDTIWKSVPINGGTGVTVAAGTQLALDLYISAGY